LEAEAYALLADGWSVDEVATEANMSPDDVRDLVAQAREDPAAFWAGWPELADELPLRRDGLSAQERADAGMHDTGKRKTGWSEVAWSGPGAHFPGERA
jgi:hypothetical protein